MKNTIANAIGKALKLKAFLKTGTVTRISVLTTLTQYSKESLHKSN